MKMCRGCLQEKDRGAFYKDRSRGGGLSRRCKKCDNEHDRGRQLRYRKAHPEKFYQPRQSAHVIAWRRWQVSIGPPRPSVKQDPAITRAKSNARRKFLRRTVPAFAAAQAFRVARREAVKIKATPGWANQFFIREAYALAALRTKLTGRKWHVDHVVPLRSKLVCGLHWEGNFRVIPAKQNVHKGNLYWPDMPEQTHQTRFGWFFYA